MALSINTFFTIIALGLLSVYFFLRPMNIQQKLPKEIAQLELLDFSMYELNATSLKSVLKGESGKRYINRYEVEHVTYIDNTKDFREEMSAGYGLYKDNVIALENSVHFKREDGLEFISDEAKYDQNHSIATTEGKFKIKNPFGWVVGHKLYYNSTINYAKASKVNGLYDLKENDL